MGTWSEPPCSSMPEFRSTPPRRLPSPRTVRRRSLHPPRHERHRRKHDDRRRDQPIHRELPPQARQNGCSRQARPSQSIPAVLRIRSLQKAAQESGSKASNAIAPTLKAPVRISTDLTSGDCRTYRRPPSTASHSAAVSMRSGVGRFHRYSTTITPKNERAFSKNAVPDPAAAITIPPSAGPIARATLNPAEFIATAAACCSVGTSSGVIACHAGSFITAPSPSKKREAQQHPRRDHMKQRQHAQRARSQHHPSLRDQQKAPPVDHVGQRARGKDDEKDGQSDGRLHQSHHQRRHGEHGHHPARAHGLHPRADVRNDGRDPHRAKQGLAQRRPRRAHMSAGTTDGSGAGVFTISAILVGSFQSRRSVRPKGHSPLAARRAPCKSRSPGSGSRSRNEFPSAHSRAQTGYSRIRSKRSSAGKGIKPHAKRARHVWTAHAQHDHPDRLHQELQHNPNHHQRRNHVGQPQEAEDRRHHPQAQQRHVGKSVLRMHFRQRPESSFRRAPPRRVRASNPSISENTDANAVHITSPVTSSRRPCP